MLEYLPLLSVVAEVFRGPLMLTVALAAAAPPGNVTFPAIVPIVGRRSVATVFPFGPTDWPLRVVVMR